MRLRVSSSDQVPGEGRRAQIPLPSRRARMHPLPDSWDWGVDQSARLAAHVPALSPAQISTQMRGASPGPALPNPVQLSDFCPFLSSHRGPVATSWTHLPSPPRGPEQGCLGWAPGVGAVDQTLCTHCQLGGLDGGSPSPCLCPLKSQPGGFACVFSEPASVSPSSVPIVSPVTGSILGPHLGTLPRLGVGSR